MYLYLWIWNSSHANLGSETVDMVQDPAKNLKVLRRSAKSKFTRIGALQIDNDIAACCSSKASWRGR